MRTVEVNVRPKPYKVHIGTGLLERLGQLDGFNTELAGRRVVLITDRTVHGLYGERVRQSLKDGGATLIGESVMEPGEAHKNLATLSGMYDDLVEARAERRDLVVALGGGVVGDVAGFAAASYLRGVDFVQVPTTLLSMVDSSVGGKTGIDHPRGKNLMGAFHQPRAVAADLSVLKTLDKREVLSGFAEVIKAAILADSELFDLLERTGPALIEDEEMLEEAVARSVAVKAQVVAEDEREGGKRALLNLGHTYGHAVETLCGFTGYTHGEGVAMGTIFATRLSTGLGVIAPADADRIEKLILDWGYPPKAKGLAAEEIKEAFSYDKKKSGDSVKWVLPEGIGRARWGCDVAPDTLDRTLTEMQG